MIITTCRGRKAWLTGNTVLAGILAAVLSSTPLIVADVNGDGRIGMEEAIYALQVISGLGGGPGQDYDGDGYTAAMGDKDDNDAGVHPGATEIRGDWIDQ